MKSTFVLSWICICILLNYSLEAEDGDFVKSLPDYPNLGTTYSGYLTLSNSVKNFHYIYQEAQTNSNTKPLVLWLNGGPGCSSMGGWIKGNGPYFITKTTPLSFTENPYSWNKEANMLYIESPGNVGFSYIDSTDEADLKVDDDITAKDNYDAMIAFFKKFPELRERDLYLSGESYAGIYIPMLANEILQHNKNFKDYYIKLKGIMVGNGVADTTIDGTASASIDFAFAHSLMSYQSRLDYIQYCKKQYNKEKCDVLLAKLIASISGINIYDIYQDCQTPASINGETPSNSMSLYTSWAFPFNLKSDVPITPCIDHSYMEAYFNTQTVKDALHITRPIQFQSCSQTVIQTYVKQAKGSIYLYPYLITSGLRILIYSGDTDAVVPFNGNQRWIDNLQLKVESPWNSWRVDNDRSNIAGYRTVYKGLTFVTIKGAGHNVFNEKPKEAYWMFQYFLNNAIL